MKKSIFSLLVLVALAGLISCKNNIEDNANEALEKQLFSILPSGYSSIGKQHNETLQEFYYGAESRGAKKGVNYKENSVEDFFGPFESCYYAKDFSCSSERSAASVQGSSDEILVENHLVSEASSDYISLVASVLDEPMDSLSETQAAITKIELSALSEKSAEDVREFVCYAETAKSSLAFWAENAETLGISDDSESAGRWIFKDFWNNYKHKLAMMAASDAAGAATGAAIGAAMGAPGGPQTAAMGAGIGAVIVGAASSAEGFRRDKVCIVIPMEQLKKLIKINK